jgi:hypothetical protein
MMNDKLFLSPQVSTSGFPRSPIERLAVCNEDTWLHEENYSNSESVILRVV